MGVGLLRSRTAGQVFVLEPLSSGVVRTHRCDLQSVHQTLNRSNSLHFKLDGLALYIYMKADTELSRLLGGNRKS